jgi:hypothetical protein
LWIRFYYLVSLPDRQKTKLEKVQHKFLRYIRFKCSIPRESHTTYNSLLSLLNLQTLEHRRVSLGLCFLYKILNGNVDCPDFLSRLTFYTPTFNTRSTNTFRLSLQVTNYANNIPCNRLMQTVNKSKIDIFSSPNLNSFKSYCNYLILNT